MSRVALAGLLLASSFGPRMLAANPGVPEPPLREVVRRMQEAIDPPRPSVAWMTLSVSGEGVEPKRRTVVQARTRQHDGEWLLTTIVAPPEERGFALLVHASSDADDARWIYLPSVRRVRKVLPLDVDASFLDSDFRWSDFGIEPIPVKRRIVMRGDRDGVPVLEVEAVPTSPQLRLWRGWTVTVVGGRDWLPLERRHHAASGALVRTERFTQVTVVDGVPTIVQRRMEEELQDGWSQLDVDRIRYDVDLSSELFSPDHLREAADVLAAIR